MHLYRYQSVGGGRLVPFIIIYMIHVLPFGKNEPLGGSNQEPSYCEATTNAPLHQSVLISYWQLSQGDPASPQVSWDRLLHHHNPAWDKAGEDGGMDGWMVG